MSKKYKNKPCTYCPDQNSGTGDHVFAREFFLEKERHNLPQVPACSKCNARKSSLEQYVMTVLPFGGLHSDAEQNLKQGAMPRLQRNMKLLRSLEKDRRNVWTQNSSGLAVPTMTLPIEISKLCSLFILIGKGLLRHHFNVLLSPQDHVKVLLPPHQFEPHLRTVFGKWPAHRARKDLGHGTILYEGIQVPTDAKQSFWRIALLGGVVLADPRTGTSFRTIFVHTQDGKKPQEQVGVSSRAPEASYL